MTGTIAESAVLASIAELAAARPDVEDLFDGAAMRVVLSRSAGALVPDVLGAARSGVQPVQLRYRSEMAEIFVDLAIDVGLRDTASTAEADTPA